MRHQGQLHQWNDEKGFGFVEVKGQGKAFVHISTFLQPARRPQDGDAIAFDLEKDNKNRLQASRVKLMGVKRDQSQKRPSTAYNQRSSKPGRPPVIPLIILLLLPLSAYAYPGLQTLTAVLAALNLVTFLLYWKDKSAARKQQRRVPEANLHLAALLGGWPAAWMAQDIFRHKTIKTSFRVMFWITVAFNLTGILVLLRQFSYL